MRHLRQTLYVMVAGLLIFGCGPGSAPTISDLKITTDPVERNKQAIGQFKVADPDGLGGLRGKVFFSGAATAEADMPIQGVTDDMTSVPVQFAFMLLPTSPTGTYTLRVAVWDGDDNESNSLSTTFALK